MDAEEIMATAGISEDQALARVRESLDDPIGFAVKAGIELGYQAGWDAAIKYLSEKLAVRLQQEEG